MSTTLPICGLRFTAAQSRDIEQGLLGWVSFQLGTLVLDGIMIRRTLRGDLRLSFPTRTDSQGRKHSIVRPVDTDARAALERQILQALSFQQEAQP